MSDSQMRKQVLANIAMMRIGDSELAAVFAYAEASVDSDFDVVVVLTVVNADNAEQIRALLPETRVAVQQGDRYRLM